MSIQNVADFKCPPVQLCQNLVTAEFTPMAFTGKKKTKRKKNWDEKWWRDHYFISSWKRKQTATFQTQGIENPRVGSYQIKQSLGKKGGHRL